MRKILVAILLTAAIPAGAGELLGEMLGAAVGGGVGSQIGRGNGNLAATVVGAVVGAHVGRELGRPNVPQGYQTFTIVPNQQGGYATGGSAPQPMVIAAPPCDELYYEGQYNPGAAAYYCRGVRIRYMRDIQRQQQEAYYRGLNGQ